MIFLIWCFPSQLSTLSTIIWVWEKREVENMERSLMHISNSLFLLQVPFLHHAAGHSSLWQLQWSSFQQKLTGSILLSLVPRQRLTINWYTSLNHRSLIMSPYCWNFCSRVQFQIFRHLFHFTYYMCLKKEFDVIFFRFSVWSIFMFGWR